jgi:hypothetical protein
VPRLAVPRPACLASKEVKRKITVDFERELCNKKLPKLD